MTSEVHARNILLPEGRLTLSGGRLYANDNEVRDDIRGDIEMLNTVNNAFDHHKALARAITRARLRADKTPDPTQPLNPDLQKSIKGLYLATSKQIKAQMNAFHAISQNKRMLKDENEAYLDSIDKPETKLVGNLAESCMSALFYRGLQGTSDDPYNYIYASRITDCGRIDENGYNQAYDAVVHRRETAATTSDFTHTEIKASSLRKAKYTYDPETLVIAIDDITPGNVTIRDFRLPAAIVHDALGEASDTAVAYLESTIDAVNGRVEQHFQDRTDQAKQQ